jgi:hypothetical protein
MTVWLAAGAAQNLAGTIAEFEEIAVAQPEAGNRPIVSGPGGLETAA